MSFMGISTPGTMELRLGSCELVGGDELAAGSELIDDAADVEPAGSPTDFTRRLNRGQGIPSESPYYLPGVSPPANQLRLAADDARSGVAPADHGYTRTRRLTPRRRAVTSFEMSLEERAMLAQLADAQGLGIGETLRRCLRLYAAQHGVGDAATNPEAGAAA